MSEWEDFTEAHGYSANDPDALEDMMSDWEEDDRTSKIYEKYQQGIEAGRKSKKTTHKIKSIGFNNFKPFGDKIQQFSKKPITLIYGPNSIGKSSFIHMSAYIRYIFETQSFDLLNTDMFGDNINLGGFDKFIHKRDKNNSITMEFDFEDCSEVILDYLPKKKYFNKDKLNTLSLFSKDNIVNIINHSEDYITPIFIEANIEENIDLFGSHKIMSSLEKSLAYENKLVGYGSGIPIKEELDVDYVVYLDEEQEMKEKFIIEQKAKINNLLEQRKNNKKCNLIYREEYDFLNSQGLTPINTDKNEYSNPIQLQADRYSKSKNLEIFRNNKIVDKFNDRFSYSYSGYYKDRYGDSPELTIKDIIRHSFINKEDNFINEDTKRHFISDVLIPIYINQEKLIYMSDKLYELNKMEETWKTIELNKEDIETIAENTLQRISAEVDEFEYYDLLKNSTVPLKITAELQYSTELKKVYLKKTEYFVQGVLFDSIEEKINTYYDTKEYFIEKIGASIHVENGEIKDFESYPPILNKISESFDNIYYSYDYNPRPKEDVHINQLHERDNSTIFLSHRKGYRNLIGAFNDMIHFNKMQYIGPLRFYPERDSTIKELDSDDRIIPNSKTSWSLLKKDKHLRETINKWLKDPNKLKTPYEITYRKLYDIESRLNNFSEMNQILLEINEEIAKFNITADISQKTINKLITEFAEKTKEADNEIYAFPRNYRGEADNYFKKLIEFSILTQEERFKKVLLEENFLDNFETKEEMIFKDLRNNTQISNRDLGLGISQILPVLIATNRNKNTTIAIEQPELHLHPAVQCEIADELIRSYKESKNEFLIETHSEHLLLRIMKRMRHTAEDREGRDKTLDLTPDDVCLLYVDADEDSTYIKELRLSKKGKLLDHWPGGFFEEGYKERFQ